MIPADKPLTPPGSSKQHKQMHSWPAVIVCLSPSLQHAHMHKLKQSRRKRKKVLSHSKKKEAFFLTVIHLMPSWPWTQSLVGKASLFLNFFFAITRTEKQNKKTGLHPFPPAPSPTDVFQQHSLSITETFAEITLETLASCCFDLIGDILVYFFFFAISYQSTKQLCDLPVFKQLTSLAAKEPAGAGHANSSSIFVREKHHCVLHNFIQTSLPIQHMPVRPSVQHVLSGSCHISIYLKSLFKILFFKLKMKPSCWDLCIVARFIEKDSEGLHRYNNTYTRLNNNSFLPPDFKWLLHFLLLSDSKTKADPACRGVRVTTFRCVSMTGPRVRGMPCRAEAIDAPCLLPIFEFSAPHGTRPGTSSKPLLRLVLYRRLKP